MIDCLYRSLFVNSNNNISGCKGAGGADRNMLHSIYRSFLDKCSLVQVYLLTLQGCWCRYVCYSITANAISTYNRNYIKLQLPEGKYYNLMPNV